MRRKETVKVDLQPFQTTYPDGLGHQGTPNVEITGFGSRLAQKAPLPLRAPVQLDAVRSPTLQQFENSSSEGAGGLENSFLPIYSR